MILLLRMVVVSGVGVVRSGIIGIGGIIGANDGIERIVRRLCVDRVITSSRSRSNVEGDAGIETTTAVTATAEVLDDVVVADVVDK